MPGTSGLAATRSILAATPGVAVLMLSMHSEETLVRQALDAGARGYILKNVDRSGSRGGRQAGRGRRNGARPGASHGRRRWPASEIG